jgi:TolB-like protein
MQFREADGITEELITDFVQSLPLRVISRTSVMRHKETSQSITQIGQELGADATVERAGRAPETA